ncbi:type I 3-dehydroquinate dehydratase [Halovenus salina]|uniref:type I 3-dehydroquinate dehydratase n=1 Tax=Halovenus salina TaxID=1510225 RepID=UPI002260FCBB|nr:type I 3-dehydroquinate dehydratase [Halovenus salina]
MNFESFVLAASTASLDDSEAATRYADALELRLDLGDEAVGALDTDCSLPVLVTNRLDSEGGDAPQGNARLETLCRAIEQPAVEAVDIELAAVRDGRGSRVVEHAREHGVTVVVSTHDFEETPERTRLLEILRDASEVGDIAKLAVTATDRGDALDLLGATHEATQAGLRVATMAMGEPGRHTRVVAPLYGSRLGYAPLSAERATAPGQYDLETVRRLYESLKGSHVTQSP